MFAKGCDGDRAISYSFHQHYLELIGEIERRFPVAEWVCGDAHLWPSLRMALYLDMYAQTLGDPETSLRPKQLRLLDHLARPASNLWKQRHDLRHHTLRPRAADALFFGDGVSLDLIDGAWEDRYCEALIADRDGRGKTNFLMQGGDMRRSPWRRPTFAANTLETAGLAMARFLSRPCSVPGLADLALFLDQQGIRAPSLEPEKVARRASVLLAMAHVHGRILDIVKPSLVFVTTWYAGTTPAFLLACRRRGILSVDIQHCPQGGHHKAYEWSGVPEGGYGVLPSLFWTWNAEDAAHIASWADGRWHRALHGGHIRMAPFLDDNHRETRRWDEEFRRLGDGKPFEREILVALQTIAGQDDILDALAERIASAPPQWRWWIRRHPAARPSDDRVYAKLLDLRGDTIRIAEASALPLSALLRHMHAVVSVASGVAAEGVPFGVPAIFLSPHAKGQFGYLSESGFARIVGVEQLHAAIDALPPAPNRPASATRSPDLSATLQAVEAVASEYARLCGEKVRSTA